jgi:hypothetical protein
LCCADNTFANINEVLKLRFVEAIVFDVLAFVDTVGVSQLILPFVHAVGVSLLIPLPSVHTSVVVDSFGLLFNRLEQAGYTDQLGFDVNIGV